MIEGDSGDCLTTTIFVKYHYDDQPAPHLLSIIVSSLPSGLLQAAYNPSPFDTIWRTGRNADSRGEAFRVRLVFAALKAKSNWRVQTIPMTPAPFMWDN